MKRGLWCIGLLISGGLHQCDAQAFSREEDCPNEPGVTGYVTVSDLNADMADELSRISDGGAPPGGGYTMILCPGENFDLTGGNTIRPVINDVTILCGGGTTVDPECNLEGNREQLLIEDSSVIGYTIESVAMEGVTFSGARRGVSVSLDASQPAVFTCTDCTWQDFDDLDYVIDISSDMTLNLENSVFRVSESPHDILMCKLTFSTFFVTEYRRESRECKCQPSTH